MGQKQHKNVNKNLLIEINPINNSYNEIYLYVYKTSGNYKCLISTEVLNEMLKIKKKSKLIEHLEEKSEIVFKESNSLILNVKLDENKYQLELYNLEDYKNIFKLFVPLDYLFLSLLFVSFLSAFFKSKSYAYFTLRFLHFLSIAGGVAMYAPYRYFQIFDSFSYKIDYKIHFYCLSLSLIPIIINAICLIGLIFIHVNQFEKLCLMGCFALEGGIVWDWSQEHFEKNTYKEVKKYFYEVQNKIRKYVKNLFK